MRTAPIEAGTPEEAAELLTQLSGRFVRMSSPGVAGLVAFDFAFSRLHGPVEHDLGPADPAPSVGKRTIN